MLGHLANGETEAQGKQTVCAQLQHQDSGLGHLSPSRVSDKCRTLGQSCLKSACHFPPVLMHWKQRTLAGSLGGGPCHVPSGTWGGAKPGNPPALGLQARPGLRALGRGRSGSGPRRAVSWREDV